MAEVARFAHHMSDEDALMWNIEKDPILRSTILAVAIFDSVPDWERLRARIDRTTLLIPRFRQRVVSPPFRMGPPRWTVEPSFDLDFHLRRIAARRRRARRARCSTRCNRSRRRASTGPARCGSSRSSRDSTDPTASAPRFAMKVHHSVTDGVGGMELLAHLVDLARDAPDASDDDIPAAPRARDRRARSD